MPALCVDLDLLDSGLPDSLMATKGFGPWGTNQLLWSYYTSKYW
jgi:hypothetical protein